MTEFEAKPPNSLAKQHPELYRNLKRLRDSQNVLATLPTSIKNAILLATADAIEKHSQEILDANQLDLSLAPKDINTAFRDRLILNPTRLGSMCSSLRAIAALDDPVGEVVESNTLANGLKYKKVRSPLGCILVIFESRPNVITEVFALGLKSGNAICARGGKESIRTAERIFAIIERTIAQTLQNQPYEHVQADFLPFYGLRDSDRSLVPLLLKADEIFDLCIPRGGEGLIQLVSKEARMPVIKNDRGLCHLFVHADADLEMAKRILINGKTQRPGVCNSLETVLLDQNLSDDDQTRLLHAVSSLGVELRVDPDLLVRLQLSSALERVLPASDLDFATEHLDLILNVKCVKGLPGALDHIRRFGSQHSESIVTRDRQTAEQFLKYVNAACTYWNASTRFTDGFTLGLGGEIGISTQRLHVRGPVGLKELTSLRWTFEGDGHIREN